MESIVSDSRSPTVLLLVAPSTPTYSLSKQALPLWLNNSALSQLVLSGVLET
jgi:hypothetical protein